MGVTCSHQQLNGTESQRTGPLSKLPKRAIRYSGFFGVRSMGPVGDFLECLVENEKCKKLTNVATEHGPFEPAFPTSKWTNFEPAM